MVEKQKKTNQPKTHHKESVREKGGTEKAFWIVSISISLILFVALIWQWSDKSRIDPVTTQITDPVDLRCFCVRTGRQVMILMQ